MKIRPRELLRSRWTIAIVCAALGYLLLGFLAVPAILGWQIEKQVADKLGHRITIGDIRFNPLLFKLQADKVALSDAQGRPMLAFGHLLVDLELRSLIDRAWTFSQIRLEQPVVELELDPDGRDNFQDLVDRLRSPEPKEDSGTPRLIVHQVAVSDARIEYRDRFLAEPTVIRVDPLSIEIERLTSLPDERGRYRISGHIAQGEGFESTGEIGLSPIAAKGHLSLSGIQVATLAKALSRRLDTDVAKGRIDVALDFDVAAGHDGALAASADGLDVKVAGLELSAPGESNPSFAVDSIALEGGRADLAAREFSARSFGMRKGSISASIDASNRVDWAKLVRAPSAKPTAAPATPATPAKSGPDSGATDTPAATTATAAPPPPQAAAPWRVSIDEVQVADIGLTLNDELHGAGATVAALGFSFAPKLEIGPDGMRAELATPRVSLAGLATKRGAERGAIEAASFEGKSIAFDERASPQAAAGKREIRFDGPKLAVTSFGFRPSGDTDRVALGKVSLGAGSLTLSLPQGDLEDWMAEGLTASFSDALVRGAGDATEIIRLGEGGFSGGTASLRDRALSLESVTVKGGRLRAWLDAKGEANLAHLFDDFRGDPSMAPRDRGAGSGATPAAASADTSGSGATSGIAPGATASAAASATTGSATGSSTGATTGATAKAAGEKPWRVAVRSAGIDGISVDFEDRRSEPVLAVGLDAIRVSADGYDSASGAPVRVEFAATARDGGALSAKGTVRAADGAADLALKVADLALAPARTLLSQYADLELASGTFSAQGRLRYRGASAGPAAKSAGNGAAPDALLDYRGGFAVNRLRLEERGRKRPILSWDAVSSTDVALSVSPNRLDVVELLVDGIDGRLVIGEDRKVNFRGVMKSTGPTAAKPAAAVEATSAARAEATSSADPFPVSIARVRFTRGSLDFADLSLRPQFATRMHALKGAIAGLSTDPARVAKIELDAKVNDYGSAKIGGQLSLRRPEAQTDVTMSFRNLEMSSLSPYVARFAGYGVTAGTLSLDLEYKVKDGKLVGANKIVINKIALGDKVEGPDSGSVPLELAIAILQDENGVIDLDVPVAGDLNDPKFDIGAVVTKAIGSFIGRIVTAPFRALGALFGAGAENADVVAFEPGSDAIAPPDLQKLASVATVLGKRPGLKLVVAGVQAPELDGPALKALSVRSTIVRGAGLSLAPGEAPGPIDAGDPRFQRAIETLFKQRYAPEVLQALKSRVGEKAPDSAFHQSLLDRMIAEEPLPDEALTQLATRRAEAVTRELTTKGDVPASRVSVAQPRKVEATSGKTVDLRLELSVDK